MDNNRQITYGIAPDMKLLQFLRSGSGERFTKLDAFCDLIGRMPEMKAGKDNGSPQEYLPFRSDTFRATITELAGHWHWHRATVRSFLDGLEKLGYLRKRLDGKEYLFTIHTLTDVAVPLRSSEQLRTLTMHLLCNSRLYELTDLQLSAYFGLYMKAFVNKDTGTSEEDYQNHVAQVKTLLVRESLANLDIDRCWTLFDSEEILPLIRPSFQGTRPWSWEKWMAGLRFLYMALVSRNFPAGRAIKPEGSSEPLELTDFSDEDFALLKKIFEFIHENLLSNESSTAGSLSYDEIEPPSSSLNSDENTPHDKP